MRRFFKKTVMASLALILAGTSVSATSTPAHAKDSAAAKNDESVANVTDASFSKEVLKSDKPVLVDFWATWCPPCRAQGPIVEEVSGELKGKIKVVKLNVDENQKTAETYNVSSIPVLIIFKNGKVVEQKLGLTQKAPLIQLINKHL